MSTSEAWFAGYRAGQRAARMDLRSTIEAGLTTLLNSGKLMSPQSTAQRDAQAATAWLFGLDVDGPQDDDGTGPDGGQRSEALSERFG